MAINRSLMPKVDRELLKKLGIRLFPIFSEDTKLARLDRLKSLHLASAPH